MTFARLLACSPLSIRWRGLVVTCVATASLLPRPTVAYAAETAVQPARAPANVVTVLAIDSDDALVLAEAVTAALRNRVRSLPGYTLADSPQSLATATAGLRCQSRPDAACQVRIADLIKTDRYLWGVARKAKDASGAAGKVELELHYFERGKPDQRITESFSDNVQDARDPYLGRLASRAFNQFFDLKLATVTMHAEGKTCDVKLDDGRTIALERGTAVVEVAPGTREFTPQPPCTVGASQVVANPNGVVDLDLLKPVRVTTSDAGLTSRRPFPMKTAVGIGVSALGVGAGVYALLQYSAFATSESKAEEQVGGVPRGENVCTWSSPPENTLGNNLRNLCSNGRGQSTRAFIAGGLSLAMIATGVVLIVTDMNTEQKAPPAMQPKAKLAPRVRVDAQVGPTTGVLLSGTF
jgi:hypothetical protein